MKTRLIWRLMLLLSLCSVLIGCAAKPQAQPVSAGDTATHQSDVVSAEGVVVPHKYADLAYKVSGTVLQVMVEQGQTVSAGTELLRIDTRSLEQNVLQAQAALSSAQAELAKAEVGSRPEEVAAAEAAYQMAQASVTVAQLAVNVAEGNVSAAEAAVQDAAAGVLSAQQAVKMAEGSVSAASGQRASAEAQLAKLKAGPTEEQIALAQKKIERAKNQLWKAQSQRDSNSGEGGALGGFLGGTEADVATAQTDLDIAQLEYEQLMKGARSEDIASAEGDVTQAVGQLVGQLAQVEKAKASVTSAESAVKRAQANLVIAKAEFEQRKADVLSAQAAAQQAKAQLDLVKAGSRPEDVAVAKAAVAQAEAQLAEAQNSLDDAVLKAPFDGTVGDIMVDEGELITPQATVLRFGDLTRLEVETTDLSEVDVNQVKVGQSATVSIDALGGKEINGTVASIATIAGDSRGDTVYKVVIELDPKDVVDLRWGMSAFVEIKVG